MHGFLMRRNKVTSLLIVLVLLLFAGHPSAQRIVGNTSYLGQVATRSFVPDGISANTQSMSRTGHIARTSITSLQLVIVNFASHVSDFMEQGPGNALTVTASIEYPQGICTQVTFSRSSTASIANLGTIASDVVSVSIPNGATWWDREYRVSAGGLVANGLVNSSSAMGDAYHTGMSGITDQTVSCDAVTDNGGGTFSPPFAIIGQTSQPSACILGDSISVGAVAGPNSSGDSGAVQRAIGPNFAYIGIANDSSTAATFNSNANRIKQAFAWCSSLVVEWVNDIATGATVAAFEASLATVFNTFRSASHNAASVQVVMQTSVPSTTSTDNWATTVNQTTKSFESNRVSANSDIRNGLVGANATFDLDAAFETAIGSGLWKAGGGFPACNPWTNDGIHPNNCGANQYSAIRLAYP